MVLRLFSFLMLLVALNACNIAPDPILTTRPIVTVDDTVRVLQTTPEGSHVFYYKYADGNFVGDTLVITYTDTTITFNGHQFPLADGWSNDRTTALSSFESGFDGTYYYRIPVKRGTTQFKIGDITFYKGIPPISTHFKFMESNTVEVRPGQNLSSIAKEMNTTVGELKRLNNLKSDNIKSGQLIKIYVP